MSIEDGKKARERKTKAELIQDLESLNRRMTETQELLTDVIENSPDAICVYDADDRMMMFNEKFRTGVLCGIGDVVAPGVSFETLLRAAVERELVDIPDGDVEEYIRLRLALHRGGDANHDVKLANGSWMRVRDRLMPGGRILGVRTDITEHRNMEEQLRQAQKMEAVGQLTGGIAHEFNNLLMIIFGNLEALESRLGKDDPLQSFASSAMKGALRGAELTQSLLAFSRKQRLERGQVDLNSLVLGMRNLLQRTLAETITIETDVAEGLWRTSADAGQIEAALLNFVLNARDAMPDGGIITLRTSNRKMTAATAAHYDCAEPGDYVTLEVSDTGSGMTDEQIEHAFEPFYTTKDVGQGTGLGLSVAFGFARQSGGCLEIASELGQGTTVRLSLPRAAEAEVGAKPEQGTSTKAVAGSGKILVVEDDGDVRQLVCRLLTTLGYEIIEAEDGPAALALFEEHPDIDLLFSDVVLPGGMSGPEAAREARLKRPDLKVLLTSGYPEKNVETLDVGGKAAAILRKPYNRFELAEAIATVMNSD